MENEIHWNKISNDLIRKVAAEKAFQDAEVDIGLDAYLFIHVIANDVGMLKNKNPFMVSITDVEIKDYISRHGLD